MADLSELQSWFSTARNEYEGTNNSVYGSFVVPPDIDSNDILKVEHSIALVGGRGMGKTVFLKYFSHWTQFDPKRLDVQETDLQNIVLYWKPDTAFCRALKPEWLGDEGAKNAFLTLAAMEVLKEFIFALKNIGHHFPEIKKAVFSDSTFWSAVSKILGTKVRTEEEFAALVEIAIYEAQTEPDNIKNKSNPKSVLDLLIGRVVNVASAWFLNTSFKVFVDEFENLNSSQQKFINNYRKHSDARLSWNIACKKYAKISSETTGPERLQEKDDYHTLSIFEDLTDKQYRLFMAEIVLNNMVRRGLHLSNIPDFTPEFLCDRKNLSVRLESSYQDKVLSEINRLFEQPSIYELCVIACSNKNVVKKLKKAFLDVKFDEEFADKVIEKFPDVAIAHFVIFYQKGFQANLAKEKERLLSFIGSNRAEQKSIDTKVTTYVYSALLSLNLDNSYINIPVYSGFDRFCYLSSRSVRSMISLIFYTVKSGKINEKITFHKIEDISPFTSDQMQMGALSASEQSIGEIVNFTPNGVVLSRFTHRLGQIFKLVLQIKGFSEPEISHFDIESNYGDFPEETGDLIEIAKTWRILIQSSNTKERGDISESAYEYKLNPFYAPFFGISYRKKRKLTFTLSDFEALYSDDGEKYASLRKTFEQKIEKKQISAESSFEAISDQASLDL